MNMTNKKINEMIEKFYELSEDVETDAMDCYYDTDREKLSDKVGELSCVGGRLIMALQKKMGEIKKLREEVSTLKAEVKYLNEAI